MYRTLGAIQELAASYDMPFEDVLFIDLNRQGAQTDIPYERIRFYFKLSDNPYFRESRERGVKDFFFAMPTYSEFSRYKLKDGILSLGDEEIGKTYGIEEDTCDSSYPRRNGTVFSLNTNSKSSCHGCAFCHTFVQTAKDVSELSRDELTTTVIDEWVKKYQRKDLSYLRSVGVVTGCFGNEKETVDYLYNVRDIFSRYNFHGEIFYVGSEITSESALDKLKQIEPFSLCLSLECFTNRQRILKHHKAKVSLEDAERILDMSKEREFGANFIYVLGLEPLDVVVEGMKRFSSHLTSMPVVNTFQAHTVKQTKLLTPKATELEYFLDARKELEKIFVSTSFRPRPWQNYRCLWYLKFGNENIDGSRLP